MKKEIQIDNQERLSQINDELAVLRKEKKQLEDELEKQKQEEFEEQLLLDKQELENAYIKYIEAYKKFNKIERDFDKKYYGYTF